MAARVDEHWDDVYRTRGWRSVTWFEDDPARSVESVMAVAPGPDSAIVDVGAGASLLVDRLLAHGYTDVTVLDGSRVALDEVRSHLGDSAGRVHFVAGDALEWDPPRRYDVWHDRAVFHFLVEEADRARYAARLRAALRPGGHAVVATFAPEGPDHCSGLPTMRYDAGSLVAALGDGLSLVHSEAAEHVTPTGATQPFTWVTVRWDG